MADPTDAAADSNGRSETSADLLKELVAHLSAQPHRTCARSGRGASARRGC